MRTIEKGPEPPVLADARRDATRDGRSIRGSDWQPAGAGTLPAIREALVREQLGLCAYCCGPIRLEGKARMQVEHWVPRSGYPDSDEQEKRDCGARALDWGNLLGVCPGTSKSLLEPGKSDQHCDVARGQQRLTVPPAQTPRLTARLTVNGTSGELKARDSGDGELGHDIETLGLNVPRLRANRAEAIQQIRIRLRKDDSPKTLLRLWRMATRAGSDRTLPNYAPAVALYLEKKLRSRNLPVEW